MKKTLLLTILIFLSLYVISQDVIFTSNGDEIPSKVVEITNQEIKYKKFEQLDGPLRNINISEVFMIIYQDGSREIFKKRQEKKEEIKETVEIKKDERLSTLIDIRDGKEYKTVKIGNQWWMSQNLDFDSKQSNAMRDSDYHKIDTIYGRLYHWEVSKKVCPSGWHLPSIDEWLELIDYLGGKKVAGGKMKVIGTEEWDEPNFGATNSSLFSALAYTGAIRSESDPSYSKRSAVWWSSTKKFLEDPTTITIYNKSESIYFGSEPAWVWCSIRCVKN